MPNEYEEGRNIGRLEGKIDGIDEKLDNYIAEQKKVNEAMDKRVRIIEQWMQTTMGKVTVITFFFGVIGSLLYTVASFIIKHFFTK